MEDISRCDEKLVSDSLVYPSCDQQKMRKRERKSLDNMQFS